MDRGEPVRSWQWLSCASILAARLSLAGSRPRSRRHHRSRISISTVRADRPRRWQRGEGRPCRGRQAAGAVYVTRPARPGVNARRAIIGCDARRQTPDAPDESPEQYQSDDPGPEEVPAGHTPLGVRPRLAAWPSWMDGHACLLRAGDRAGLSGHADFAASFCLSSLLIAAANAAGVHSSSIRQHGGFRGHWTHAGEIGTGEDDDRKPGGEHGRSPPGHVRA
jgi:hypothetical protein